MRVPRLIVFDLDGTLIDSLPATIRCFQEAVAPHLGRTPSREEVVSRFGPADHRIVSVWVGDADAAEAVERLYACYERCLDAMQPYPGMVGLPRDLRDAGFQVALFTGRGRPSTEFILRTTGFAGEFDAIVTGEEPRHPKPAPDGLLLILERLGIPAEEAVYVGDSPLDGEAARAAGMTWIAAAWGGGAEKPDPSGGLSVEDVPALRRLLLDR